MSIEELRKILKDQIKTKEDLDLYLKTIIASFVQNKDIEEFKRALSVVLDKLEK